MSQPSTNLLRLRLKKSKLLQPENSPECTQASGQTLFMWRFAAGACSNLSPNSAINPRVIVPLTWLTAAQVKFIPPVSWSY